MYCLIYIYSNILSQVEEGGKLHRDKMLFHFPLVLQPGLYLTTASWIYVGERLAADHSGALYSA